MSAGNDTKQKSKLEQFLEDLNKLLEHYQYNLSPVLNFTQNGIFPQMKVVDKLPKPMAPTSDTVEPSKPEESQPTPEKVAVAPEVEAN